jgi:hypothetical protein
MFLINILEVKHCLFLLLLGLGFEFRTLYLQGRESTAWATPPVHFCCGCFEDGISRTICLGRFRTEIITISVSQVAWITDSLSTAFFFLINYNIFVLLFFNRKLLVRVIILLRHNFELFLEYFRINTSEL